MRSIGIVVCEDQIISRHFPTKAEPNLTIEELPYTPDDYLLVKFLRENCVECQPIYWNRSIINLQDIDCIIVRSPWDYVDSSATKQDFLKFIEKLEAQNVPTFNHPGLLRWLLDKQYLFDLQSSGVNIVPSIFYKAKVVELGVILGQQKHINNLPLKNLEKQILNIFGVIHQPIPDSISFTCSAASNHFNSESSEALILPELWSVPNSINAPVLSNLTQHRRRFYRSVQMNIPRIFELQTANLLLASLADEEIGMQCQAIEYVYHEAGHATGLGIKRKVQENLLLTNWFAAVEEWRADGVEFEIAFRTLSSEDMGKLVAANLCLRFGLDAQRAARDTSDAHAMCSLLTLDSLLKSGAFCVQQNKLALINLSYEYLAGAVEVLRTEAVSLTHEEIATDSIHCYRAIKPELKTEKIFYDRTVKCLDGTM